MALSGKNAVREIVPVFFRHDSEELDKAYAEGERLMKGVTSLACLGDQMALASFSLIPPIRHSLIGACTKENEAMDLIREQGTPKVLFTSELLEQGYGIDLIRSVKAMRASTLCLLFLRRERADVVEESLDAGADACMFVSALSSDGDSDFLHALRRTLAGGTYFPKSVRGSVKRSDPIPDWVSDLTVRELEVIQLLGQGDTNDEMAASLGLSKATVRSHMSSILGKVGVADRTKLLAAVFRAGSVD